MQEELRRQNVYLPVSLVARIKRARLDKGLPIHGAMQEILRRGAELALAELTGGETANQSDLEDPGKPLYNSVQIATAKKKMTEARKQLSGSIQALDQAILFVEGKGLNDSVTSPRDSRKAKKIIADLEREFSDLAPQIEAHADAINESVQETKTRKRPHAG